MVNNARGYAALLRQHIQKENGILFPLADQVIPVAQQAQVAEDFERVEHEETGEGVHEKYLALAEALEAGGSVMRAQRASRVTESRTSNEHRVTRNA